MSLQFAIAVGEDGSVETPLDPDSPPRVVMSNYADVIAANTAQRNKLLLFADHADDNDYWDYILFGWLFKFGSNRTYNFKDPSDDAGSGKLTIHGTVNNHADGLEFIGGSGWAETGIPAALLGASNANLGGWSRHSVAIQNAFIGCETGGFFNLFLTNGATLETSPLIGNSFEAIALSSNIVADKLLQRNGGNYEYYQNGSFVGSSVKAFNDWGNESKITLNKYASTIQATTHVARYALIVRTLDATRAEKLYQGLQTLYS